MLKKWMASVGIGSAKVDTQLENTQLVPGEELRGKVVIEGGNAEQQVDRINLFLMTEAVREKDDRKVYEEVKLASFTVGSAFTIKEREKKEFDFQFSLPVDIPPTLDKTRVWVQTGVDVPNAIDPKDRDYIKVTPHPYTNTVLDALLKDLGFRLRKVEMEYSRRHRYVQEFEFVPGPEFSHDLDELEVLFFMKEDGIELILQVDRRAKGLGGLFAEALEMDESFVRVIFTKEEVARGTTAIADKLRREIRSLS